MRVRVKLDDVSFSYPVYGIGDRSLKVSLMKQFGQSDGTSLEVRALRHVSFELRDGDRVGLVGTNGAGKSTLLRLIGGLSHPTSGRISIEGRIVPLIDKGLGINPELSARENIELPMLLLGATLKEIRAAGEGIREFTDLGPFFDLPVRRYSEGMRARLSFALSTAIPADVLVLDEWLSAGDALFVQKAEQRLTDFLDHTRVVVLASHSIELVRSVCNKAAWMHNGELVAFGDAEEVIARYLEACARGSAQFLEFPPGGSVKAAVGR